MLSPERTFVYDIPTRVYFGKNQLHHLGFELAAYGKNVLLCYGGGSIKKSGLYDRVVSEIKQANLNLFELCDIAPNPRIDSVRRGAEICRKEHIDVVLAVGGGSVIDCTKYIAVATYYDGDAWDLLTAQRTVMKAVPIVSVLTISATGSEMNHGGVISNTETKDKLGRLYFPYMQPKVSFLDPVETFSVSKYQTACGSADILSHLLEIYFIPEGSMYMLDCFMEGMMKTLVKYAPIALAEPDNYEARANLMWTGSWAINGMAGALQNVAWTCHPIEHEISAIYDITHGLGLAVITPRWMRYVLDETTALRFRQYGMGVFGIDPSMPLMQSARKSIELTEDWLFNKLGLTSTLTALGIDDSNIATMARKVCEGKDSKNGVLHGFKPLNQHDIETILRNCL